MRMRRRELVVQRALLIVQQPRRNGNGGSIADIIESVRSVALQRPGVLSVEPYAEQEGGRAALLVIAVERPRALKGIVGKGITTCLRDVDERAAASIARRFDETFAAAALRWSTERRNGAAHA